MTSESCINSATILSCVYFFGYAGHATVFTVQFSSRVSIRSSVCLANSYARVFVLLCAVNDRT